jgi:hypothetical protein
MEAVSVLSRVVATNATGTTHGKHMTFETRKQPVKRSAA